MNIAFCYVRSQYYNNKIMMILDTYGTELNFSSHKVIEKRLTVLVALTFLKIILMINIYTQNLITLQNFKREPQATYIYYYFTASACLLAYLAVVFQYPKIFAVQKNTCPT